MPSEKKMENYVLSVLSRLDAKPRSLSKNERMLGGKLKETNKMRGILDVQIRQLRTQIRQAESRLQDLARDHMQILHKGIGFAESLIALEFGDEIGDENRPVTKNRKKRKSVRKPSSRKQRRPQ